MSDPAQASESSLVIPISSATETDLFVEIFPEEMKETQVSTLLQVLKDEDSNIDTWNDAALMYMQQKQAKDSLALLEEACEMPLTRKEQRVRVLAATGIALLATQQQEHGRSRESSSNNEEDMTIIADQKFNQAGKVDTFFPMTWVGKGMLNLYAKKLDQAQFFFQTTIKQCGPVLPALLGMAARHFNNKEYRAALEMYAKAIRKYPQASGAPARVGFGLTCCKLGQIDRAKAAFARAIEIDPENVEAMVGAAVLDITGVDETSKDYSLRVEKAIKMISVANLLDHTNAMVQNHLANHYWQKWAPLNGTVEMTRGSNVVKVSQAISVEPGERIRIGPKFEAIVKDEDATGVDGDDAFRISDVWNEGSASGLKVWKKDYDRVIALAKGAYGSTVVKEIQAESLFFLARVYHARGDIENAFKFYDKACSFSPKLTPARYGLAQVYVARDLPDKAMEELRKVIAQSPNASDALALLGLLEVRSRKLLDDGLAHLRKAIELDPLNPDLLVMEALAFRQHEATYSKALEGYKKAIDLTKRRGDKISYELYVNAGVLYHEAKLYDDAIAQYRLALNAIDPSGLSSSTPIESVEDRDGRITSVFNDMFMTFVDLGGSSTADSEDLSTVMLTGVPKSTPLSPGSLLRLGDTLTGEISEASIENSLWKVRFKAPLAEPPAEDAAVFVARENSLMKIPEAVTIAFNIARAHEAAGRTLAAVELHKAILKRHPAYVNSYLRLACIARDCGFLTECSKWLKIGAEVAPGDAEVLVLIGNLHLSLADFKPAQKVFENLLMKKLVNVEAYALLSMGNVYFENLHVSTERYSKHLMYAQDFYKKILQKDPLNAYAANGIGTILAEKGELFKAKETFNRVREVSGDSIADALLNLGHLYLAQKKFPEALQMYQSYLKRTEDGTTPITSKSRKDDVVDVLLYIAFSYYDWARHADTANDASAAPAVGRYKEAMKYLETATEKQSRKNTFLRYNLCMVQLSCANCIVRNVYRNIPITVNDLMEAQSQLRSSLEIVQQMIKDKEAGVRIAVSTSNLNDFVKNCQSNIAAVDSHLIQEQKRQEQVENEREILRQKAELDKKTLQLKEQETRERLEEEQRKRDEKAQEKMRHLQTLKETWTLEQATKAAQKEKRAQKRSGEVPPPEVDEPAAEEGHGLFDSSDEESSGGNGNKDSEAPSRAGALFGDDSEDEGAAGKKQSAADESGNVATKESDLFGSDDESVFEEEDDANVRPQPISGDLLGNDDNGAEATGKRGADASGVDPPSKKQRTLDNGGNNDE